MKVNWDFVGIATSVACAIHCAVLPVILSSFPLFGINIIHNSFFEWGMIMIAFFVGSFALMHGLFRHHRNILPLSIFSAGFIFLILKQFLPDQHFLFMVIAVAFIISAHILNFRLSYKTRSENTITAKSERELSF